VLGLTVGNEIPGPIVRWTVQARVEQFLRVLRDEVKSQAPEALVTYGSFPTTEYLDLPFLDFLCFNVYLESPPRLDAFLARLQNIAGDRPLVLGELGLDSRRHGLLEQADSVTSQLRVASGAGCAGVFVFSWTDEWHRGGYDVEDWDFGLTTRDRRPKPALEAFARTVREPLLPADEVVPRVSVVVCAYNAAATLNDCLRGATALDYPDFEVIVVDDGSTDETSDIARSFPVRVIRTENRGLSNARNTGIDAATGDVVAFVDADARPDEDWLAYLVMTLTSSDFAGVGGPNVPPPGGDLVERCVAQAPGGPVHVLLSDREAEHIPGCNMAFRKDALEAVGGFDPRFRVAGDDVDLCWKLQERGRRLGFSPAAMVWHHQRPSVKAYWRQQWGYGKAEALLEAKWPEKYNSAGHVTWGGRVYRGGSQSVLYFRSRVYHGTWGEAAFQSRHSHGPRVLWSLTSTPEWYLVVAALGVLATLGLAWPPLLLALPPFFFAGGALVVHAVDGASRAIPGLPAPTGGERAKRVLLTAGLHLIQPAGRLLGRLSYGLTPWRLRHSERFALPIRRTWAAWSESWKSGAERLEALERVLQSADGLVRRGGAYDRWDLEVPGGSSGVVRLLQCVEEHGEGKQLVRIRLWPRVRGGLVAMAGLLALLAAGATVGGSWVASLALGLAVLALVLVATRECSAATAVVLGALESLRHDPPEAEDREDPIVPPNRRAAPESTSVAALAWRERSETRATP
jgi:glycosyltransferase involved in cell wall biosynthesis